MSYSNPAKLLSLGIAAEPTYGLVVAPSRAIPVDTFSPVDQVRYAEDASWRASAATTAGHTLTTRASGISLGGPVLPDALGWALAGVLGDLQVAGSGPYTWTMAPLNTGAQQPHSYTFTVNDPSGSIAFPGCRFSNLTLSAGQADGLLTWTAQASGLAGQSISRTVPPPLTSPPLPAWSAQLTLGGIADVTCLTFSTVISRAVTAKRNTNGALDPYLQRSGPVTVTGKATVLARADTYRQALTSGTSTSVDFHLAYGASSLRLHSSLAYLTTASRTYSGKWIELDLGWVSDANSSDVGTSGGLSPLLATLTNNTPAGIY